MWPARLGRALVGLGRRLCDVIHREVELVDQVPGGSGLGLGPRARARARVGVRVRVGVGVGVRTR